MGRALVCLSGGLDSTVSLLRSTEEFDGTRAVFVDTRGSGPPAEAVESCRILGVELLVIPGASSFETLVKRPSMEMLEQGLTPNPCAMCNRLVKLALPFSELGGDEFLVTGHYAKMQDGRLLRGADPGKDQSYFLSMVPMEILSRCCFPLGGSLKTEVRTEGLHSGLPFISRESQDLCFSLEREGVPGDIVNTRGEVVGRHSGLGGYTPGQRKGIGAHGEKMFVTRLEPETNRVVIGGRESLYRSSCMLDSINWLAPAPGDEFRCLVQNRYRKPPQPALARIRGERVKIVFHEPQRALSPGQIGTVYLGDSVLLGGVIRDIET